MISAYFPEVSLTLKESSLVTASKRQDPRCIFDFLVTDRWCEEPICDYWGTFSCLRDADRGQPIGRGGTSAGPHAWRGDPAWSASAGPLLDPDETATVDRIGDICAAHHTWVELIGEFRDRNYADRAIAAAPAFQQAPLTRLWVTPADAQLYEHSGSSVIYASGAWYRRVWFDDGMLLRYAENGESRIDSVAQSWSVLSAGGNAERSRPAMFLLDRHLVRRDGGLIQLLALINLAYHARSLEAVPTCRIAPYVVAADVYSCVPHIGRGNWSWYTGAAGIRTVLEGVDPADGGIALADAPRRHTVEVRNSRKQSSAP